MRYGQAIRSPFSPYYWPWKFTQSDHIWLWAMPEKNAIERELRIAVVHITFNHLNWFYFYEKKIFFFFYRSPDSIITWLKIRTSSGVVFVCTNQLSHTFLCRVETRNWFERLVCTWTMSKLPSLFLGMETYCLIDETGSGCISYTHTHTNIACNVTRLFFFFASTMVDRMPGPILSFYSFSFMYFRSQSFRLVVPFVSDVLLFSRSFLARSDKLSRFMQSSILRLKKIEVKKKTDRMQQRKVKNLPHSSAAY